MMKRVILVSVLVLGLAAVVTAEDQVTITDITVDKLLDGVRVTIVCDGPPNVSSFVSRQPAAVVFDFMNAGTAFEQDRFDSDYYPVAAVTVQPSEATAGVRVAIRLRDLVESKVTQEGNLVIVDLGTMSIPESGAPAFKDPFVGKNLTLLVKDADIDDVLRMIASQFDLNILVTQDVKQIVTVRLNQVPLRLGLDALLKSALCNMVELEGGVIVVKPIKKEMFGEMETRVYDLDYVEANDVKNAIEERLLSPDGRVMVSYRRVGKGGGTDRSAVLVVSDLPEAHEMLAEFLAVFDRPVAQVAIEAKFIETTRTSEDRFGIDWQIRASANSGPWDPENDFAIPITFDGMMLGKISLDQMNASLEVMATRGNSRVLANPRTITLDNQTAKISMGVEVPLREVSKDETGLVTYTWTTRSIPIKLEVTPHITSDGKINMSVKPSVEAITGWVGSADDQQPIVAKREAETQVTVADGEVIVIGGLVKEEETRTVGKIPLLGDIPILGHLFKKTSIRREQNDLMIFIIPHILPES